MGKSRRTDKEYSKEQRLRHENQQLKKEIAYLRKQLSRIDHHMNEQVSETIENFCEKENIEYDKKIALEKLQKEWACRQCEDGYLKITVINRIDGQFYYRKCVFCQNRTKLKKFNEFVKGIFN